MLGTIVSLILLFFIFLIFKKVYLKPSPSDTSAGAIVMGIGIFINGSMKNIYFLDKYAGRVFAAILFLLWIFIWYSFANSFFNCRTKDVHLKDPIKSFAIGTWVAGTSVCGIAVYQRLTGLNFLAYILFFLAVALWIFYVVTFIRGYRGIYKNNLFNKVNGVLLISTVSTQSIVVLGNTIFHGKALIPISRLLIYLGIIFYIFAFVLIIRRYFADKCWTIEDDWQNTNCIIHGAMSITGLASVTSGALDYNFILFIWLWVLLWLVIVEAIEIIRIFKRATKYGFIKGIAIYNVTQWSRLFTFGMLYAFTMRFNIKLTAYSNEGLISLQNFILTYWKWVVLYLLIIEGILFFKYELKSRV
jgi:hypothetical protein